MMVNYNKTFNTKITIARVTKTLAMILLLSSPQFSFADFPEEQPSSRAAALSYSAVGLTDGWSIFFNQAGLGYQESTWVGAHHENRFITPELSFSALGVILPVKNGSFGVSIKRMGFSQFNQTKAGLAFGMKLAPTFSAGIQLNAHHVYFAGEYGSTTAFTAEGGMIYSPTSSLDIGFHIINPTRSRLYDEERIPTILNLGLAYKLSEMVIVTASAEKNIDADFSFKAGIEFMPINNLYFRTGMASNPSLLSFGLGYEFSSIQFDFAFTRHEILGYTPHFSLSYTFERKERSATTEPSSL